MAGVAPVEMQTQREGGFRYLFPKKDGPKGKQKDKSDRSQIGFRVPPDLAEYIAQIEEQGYSTTEIMLKLVYLSRDVVEGMGELWWDVELKARRDGVSVGVALAELAKQGLKKK